MKGDTLQDVAGGGVDRECRAALEKLCQDVEPGSGRIRRCFEANEGKLTPSCREQVYERKSEATAILAMAPRKEGEPKSQIEPTSKIEPQSKIEPRARSRPRTRLGPTRLELRGRFSSSMRRIPSMLNHPTIIARSRPSHQYYDDPWYYEEREASYTMTSRPAPDDPHLRSTEVVKGNITHVKQVRNMTRGGQNTVVEIKPPKGNLTIVDLGPTQPLLDMALTKEDSIAVTGPTEHIGPYSVLMANQVRSGARNVDSG